MTNHQLKNLIRETIEDVLRESCPACSESEEPCTECGSTKDDKEKNGDKRPSKNPEGDEELARWSKPTSDEPEPFGYGSDKGDESENDEFREWLAEVKNHPVVKLVLVEYATNKNKTKTNKILKNLYNKSK